MSKWIYILCDREYQYEYPEPEEIIMWATTDINDILNELQLKNYDYIQMLAFSILIMPENDETYFDLRVHDTMYQEVEDRPNKFMLENPEQYNNLLNSLHEWCEYISKERIRIVSEKERIEQEKLKEERRILYEKLKKEFEGE